MPVLRQACAELALRQTGSAATASELKSGAGSTVLAKYAYDTPARLTQTQGRATSTLIETYGYDVTGNRTSLTTSAGTASYS